MGDSKRSSHKSQKSLAEVQKAKRTKTNRFNQCFIENGNGKPTEREPTTDEKGNSSIDSNDHNQNARAIVQHSMSNEELVRMFSKISAVNKVVSNQLKSACEKLRLHRTESTLGIRETKISDDDIPLLASFEKYDLPLKTKEEVEALDAELEKSNDFLKFFVSSELLIFDLTLFCYQII